MQHSSSKYAVLQFTSMRRWLQLQKDVTSSGHCAATCVQRSPSSGRGGACENA
jgi:hypothetical protein